MKYLLYTVLIMLTVSCATTHNRQTKIENCVIKLVSNDVASDISAEICRDIYKPQIARPSK